MQGETLDLLMSTGTYYEQRYDSQIPLMDQFYPIPASGKSSGSKRFTKNSAKANPELVKSPPKKGKQPNFDDFASLKDE